MRDKAGDCLFWVALQLCESESKSILVVQETQLKMKETLLQSQQPERARKPSWSDAGEYALRDL